MTQTIRQQELAAANLGVPPLFLTDEDIADWGESLDHHCFNFRPPLPTFSPKEIADELGRLEKPKYGGTPKEL